MLDNQPLSISGATKADFLFYPGFFNPNQGFRLTEWRRHSPEEIINILNNQRTRSHNQHVLAITSCHDDRWESYSGQSTDIPMLCVGRLTWLIHTRVIQADYQGERVDMNVILPQDDTDIRKIQPREKPLSYVVDAANSSGGVVCLCSSPNAELASELYDQRRDSIDVIESYRWEHNTLTDRKGLAVSGSHNPKNMFQSSTLFTSHPIPDPESIRSTLKQHNFSPIYHTKPSLRRNLARLKLGMNTAESLARSKIGL